MIYPLVAGVASDHLGEASPFWISGALVLTTIAMGSQLGRYSSRTQEFAAEVSGEATAEAKAAE